MIYHGEDIYLAHHDATHGDERRGSKAPLLSSKQTGDGDIASSPQLTVSLDNDTTTEVVENKSLMSLGKTQLPGETGVLDTSPSRGTSTTVVTRDEDMVSLGFGHTRSDDTNTSLGDKLYGYTSAGVGALEIVDQLLEILNGVNVVVGRRTDETDTRRGVTGLSNGARDLVARKLTTLTRLSTLSHLDLELVGIGKVVGGNTETSGSDLLDRRAHGVTVLHTQAALRVLTTLTSVGLTAKAVHSNSKGRVGLHGNGSVGHGTSDEAAHNVGPRLDLVDGDGSTVIEVEVKETTEGAVLDALVLSNRVCLVRLVVLGADGILDVGHGSGVVDVRLTSVTPMVLASLSKTGNLDDGARWVTPLVESESVGSNQLECHTLDTGSSSSEASVNDRVIKTKNLENLSTLVG
jgi:hypothetical protein